MVIRATYTLNAVTGEYHTNSPSPTSIPNDPPLAASGVLQSQELAAALTILDPAIGCIFSSPFYRCLQTIQPAAEKLRKSATVRVDNGIGEWYGVAPFIHPSPASHHLLATQFFPSLNIDQSYTPSLIPSSSGETIAQLHDRVANALDRIISHVDTETKETDTAMLICTHAATSIAIGRCLTGRMPENVDEEDFLAPCAGLTKFVRRKGEGAKESREDTRLDWRDGKGVQGGWNCVMNGDCSHLAGGAERTWGFKDAEL
ncbi:MAG: hypothetical protein Q9219_004947 [cf. Caloplaca sp. 3 TL-2023]